MTREKIKGGLILLVIVLFIIFTGQLIYHFFLISHFEIDKITVETEVHLNDEELLRLAEIKKKEYYFSLNTQRLKESLEQDPRIRKAYVEKIFPSALRFVIYGRGAVALTLIPTREKTSFPVAIDNQGIVFQLGRDLKSWDWPVLSGLRFETLETGMQLPGPVLPVVEDLKKLQSQASALYALISEVQIRKKRERDFELILFFNHYSVPVRVGRRLDEQVLRHALMVLDVLERQQVLTTMKELDFRSGDVVYRWREE